MPFGPETIRLPKEDYMPDPSIMSMLRNTPEGQQALMQLFASRLQKRGAPGALRLQQRVGEFGGPVDRDNAGQQAAGGAQLALLDSIQNSGRLGPQDFSDELLQLAAARAGQARGEEVTDIARIEERARLADQLGLRR